MENFRKDPRIFIAQVFAAGMLVIYLLMLTLDARGQSFSKPVLTDRATSLHTVHQINKVKAIYTSQIGVRENQPNAGKEVEKYLRYVNLPKGNPWCAAFVCWVYGEAGVRSPRSGWTPDLFGESRIIWSRVSSIKYQDLGGLNRTSEHHLN